MTKLARTEPVTRKNGVLLGERGSIVGDVYERRAYWFDNGAVMILSWVKDGRRWEAETNDAVNLEPYEIVRLRDFLAMAPKKGVR